MNIFNWIPAAMRDSILRHLLTALGGVLISKGYITEDVLNQAIGAILTLFGIVWAMGNKTDESNALAELNTIKAQAAAVTPVVAATIAATSAVPEATPASITTAALDPTKK